MKVVRTIAELREGLAPRRGASIGLVPTMGALHDGHLSLLRAARAECHTVVLSVFVNPAQFQDAADLERYPRDEGRDLALAEEAGVDVVFAPAVEELYPPGTRPGSRSRSSAGSSRASIARATSAASPPSA